METSTEQRVTSTKAGVIRLQIIPMEHCYVLQIESDIVRGTIWCHESVGQEDMDKLMGQIYKSIDGIIMGESDPTEFPV